MLAHILPCHLELMIASALWSAPVWLSAISGLLFGYVRSRWRRK